MTPVLESFEEAVEFAADLIRIPGPPGGEERVARRVVEEMRRLGYDRAWTDAAGNAIGVIRGRRESAPVMLSCHLDVVDPGDRAGWQHDPYGGVVADGWLHGRGAMDIKGPLALQTYAAARFVEDRPAGDLVVAHTVLEERGGWGMDHLLCSVPARSRRARWSSGRRRPGTSASVIGVAPRCSSRCGGSRATPARRIGRGTRSTAWAWSWTGCAPSPGRR